MATFGAVFLGGLVRAPAADRLPPAPVFLECTGIRAVVVIVGETDPGTLDGIRNLGANTVVTLAGPSAAAGAAAAAAGLHYVPFLSSGDVVRLLVDSDYAERLRAIPNLTGFHYADPSVLEGYTSPFVQQRCYAILKGVFPESLVLHPTRLDPVATDPTYLDDYFRPEYSDLVAPYFYPVGTTVLGVAEDGDPWEERLAGLLAPVAARMPAGKGVLPVLQAFEQIGYPVSGAIASRQIETYRRFWPANRNAAAFWWGGGTDEPLAGLSEAPNVMAAFRDLFAAAPARPEPRAAPARGRGGPGEPAGLGAD